MGHPKHQIPKGLEIYFWALPDCFNWEILCLEVFWQYNCTTPDLQEPYKGYKAQTKK